MRVPTAAPFTRFDRRSNQEQDISVWPMDNPGHGAEDLKYRFSWTQPIVISPHDPHVIYTSAGALPPADEGKSLDRDQSRPHSQR